MTDFGDNGLGSAASTADPHLFVRPHLARELKHRHTAASEIRPKAAIASRETVTI
jgi:hypothetical protein